MRPARPVQTSFTAGELDPRLAGRIDVTRYYSGARTLRNVLVMPQGGVRLRPGMRHLAHFTDASTGIRLIPFAFNVEQTYCLVLSAGMFRVFLSTGELVASVTGCPWTGHQATQIDWTQSADTLILAHRDLPPQIVRRGNSHASWSREALALTNLPTFDFGAVARTGTMRADPFLGIAPWNGLGTMPPGSYDEREPVGPVLVLHSSAGVFLPGHVGWEVRGNGGRCRIGRVETPQLAHCTATVNFSNAKTFEDWALCEPLISADRGWPGAVAFHGGRLWFGAPRSRPNTLMGSVVEDYWNFDQGDALDDRAIVASVRGDQVDAIHQLHSGRSLQVFTAGAELAVNGGPPITPKTVSVDEQTRRGIKPFTPVIEVDGAVLFIQRGGAGLRQFLFAEAEQAYRSDLLSLLAPHLIRDPVDMAVRRGMASDDADNVVIVNADGQAVVLTTLRAQEITAFSRWETMGGDIRGVAALMSGEMFFAVVRAGAVHIERWEEGYQLDASVRIDSATPVSEVSGLEYLAGMSPSLILDGVWQGACTVTAGKITLPRPARSVQVGLPIGMAVETMPIEARDPAGNMLGVRSRIHEVTLRLRETGPISVQGQPVAFRAFDRDPLDAAPPPFTGDVTLRGLAGWGLAPTIEIVRPNPAGPFTLLAVTARAMVAA